MRCVVFVDYGDEVIIVCWNLCQQDWYRLVLRTFNSHGGNSQMPYVALVGNKNDLRHLTAVRVEQHNRFAQVRSK
jgi:hypothetical protein